MTRGLGYRPAPAQPGDLPLGAHPRLGTGAIPDEHLDGVDHVQGILNQGGSEGCVGVSLAQAFQVQLSLEGLPPVLPSASFIWWNSRKSHGEEGLNVGTYIYSGAQAVRDLGLPPDEDWPLSEIDWRFAERPSALAYQHGYDARFDVRVYRVGQTHDEVRKALLLGPVVLGTAVTRAFVAAGPHESPLGPPRDGEEIAGGHAMTAVGYDRGGVRVPQTWGRSAGNNGWYYLSWDYILSDWTSEVVVVQKVPRLS